MGATGKAFRMAETRLALILFLLAPFLRIAAWRDRAFAARLKEKRLVAQITTRDGAVARSFDSATAACARAAGCHPAPDVTHELRDGGARRAADDAAH